MRYVKQLDAIRAIAVIFVMISHWIAIDLLQQVPWGSIGVDIFFALSGFLITRILLENRNQTAEEGKLPVIKNFIIRRTLRIFPIYYFTIFFLVFYFPFLKSHFVYFLTYSSNFVMFNKPEWVGTVSHLWSLAVEEQFYLFWPWIMIFAPQKYLLRIIFAFIVTGVASKLSFHFYFPKDYHVHVLTTTCFDAFGLGALLSYFMVYKKETLKKFEAVMFKVFLLSLLCLVVVLFFHAYDIFGRTLTSICAVCIIKYALGQKNDLFTRVVLNNQALIFMGKLSYGIYIFHNFVPGAFRLVINYLNVNNIRIPFVNYLIPPSIQEIVLYLESFVILMILAWLSWTVIEKPFLSLKRYFEYSEDHAKSISPVDSKHTTKNGMTLRTKTNA